eukprot:6073035-Prymnesium_polylepis.1
MEHGHRALAELLANQAGKQVKATAESNPRPPELDGRAVCPAGPPMPSCSPHSLPHAPESASPA